MVSDGSFTYKGWDVPIGRDVTSGLVLGPNLLEVAIVKLQLELQHRNLFNRYCGPVDDADAGITVDAAVGNIINLFDDKF